MANIAVVSGYMLLGIVAWGGFSIVTGIAKPPRGRFVFGWRARLLGLVAVMSLPASWAFGYASTISGQMRVATIDCDSGSTSGTIRIGTKIALSAGQAMLQLPFSLSMTKHGGLNINAAQVVPCGKVKDSDVSLIPNPGYWPTGPRKMIEELN